MDVTRRDPVVDDTVSAGAGAIDPASLRTEPVSDAARYEIRDVLGTGGMGEVQLCFDRRTGREVAFKSGLPGRTQDQHRFAREALIQARLEHPAFVPVYDVGARDDGSPYFTMRRIRGGTLRTVLADDENVRVSKHRLLGAFVQLCLALDYAHSRGVIHRDLKPENVIFGDFGEVYVLDWGIAKLAREIESTGPAQEPFDVDGPGTIEGSVLGTIGYMAPEQLRGQLDIDKRADVYSLGAILFEIVARIPLHPNATLANRVVGEDLDRSPASRAPARDVPPEIDAICARATEPERDDRYPTARALAEAIERFLEGDRDTTLRKHTAREHVARAAQLLDSAAGTSMRVDAGREATRALAFDPDNVDARRILLDVITSAPAEIPPEALAAAQSSQREGVANLNRWYANGMFVVCASFAVVLLLSGIRERALFATMLVLGFGSGVVFLYAAHARAHASTWQTVGFLLIGATNVCLTRWVGPWIIVPMAMLINTLTLSFHGSRRDRIARTVLGLVVLVLPTILDESGLVSRSFEVVADQLVIHARLADFSWSLPWLLTGTGAMLLGATTFFFGRLLDRLGELEARAHAQAWMLRHVVDQDSRSGTPSLSST